MNLVRNNLLIFQKFPFLSVFKNLKTLVFLAITTWIAHFWHSASFGLYEDDWTRVTRAMELNWFELWDFILRTSFYYVRPLHDGLIYLFSFLGLKLGGLQVVYVIGYAILTINSFLFYLLLKRIFANHSFAIIGALAFCLFPADTTQPFLTHSLGVQPSLTLLLMALHFYLSERKKLSYLVIFISLFGYEPIFPVFLAAPLLKKEWDSRLTRKLFRHAVVLGAMIVVLVILRKVIGEYRVSTFGNFEAILLVGNPIVGPITSMSMFFYRPIETLFKVNGELLVLLPLCFAGFTWVFSRLKVDRPNDALRLTTKFESIVFRTLKLPKTFKNLAKPVTTGLIMLVLAYPLTLTTVGFSTSGRGTRVHTAAIFGASILITCICSVILRFAATHSTKRLATLGLAGFFTLLVGFGIIVQRDYKMSWEHQRAFWTDLIELCPDLDDNTVIFVEPTGLRDTRQLLFLRKELTGVPDTRQIKSLESTYMYKGLPTIYKFPDDWDNPPRVYRLPIGWREKILTDENLLLTKMEQVGDDAPLALRGGGKIPTRKVESSNVIFLETKNGQLTRRTKPLIINGQKFRLKEKSASKLSSFAKASLYKYLIKDSGEESIDYLIQS
ncbi:MAG: hypothetical protein AB4038_12370 [Prochloraceae cyanobacterium]